MYWDRALSLLQTANEHLRKNIGRPCSCQHCHVCALQYLAYEYPKQARAEVLAAVQVWQRRLADAWANDYRAYMTALVEDGPDLQPAASDLEALLRDTETKAIDGQQEAMTCGHAAANLQPSDETAEFCVVCELLRKAKLEGEEFMWNLAHEPARCSHARANWKDPEWGTPAYKGKEKCEACQAISAQRDWVAKRLRHIADGYEEGGHTHRARAFRAIADELGQLEKARASEGKG
jgi:hypothetical protein